MAIVFEKPKMLAEKQLHYCPGSLENDIANLKTLMDTAMSNAELFGSDL